MAAIRANGREIELSKPDKVMFPDEGITKKEMAEYYRKISGHMLPYLESRPVMLHRFPEGIGGKGFYQKEVPDYFPDWIGTIEVRVKKEEKEIQKLVHCDSAATLVYMANQAAITPHVWLSRKENLEHPDRMVYDLDPPGDDFSVVRQCAGDFRELFDELELAAFAMTTGSKGLHLVLPLDGKAGYEESRQFARDLAGLLAGRHPDRYTTETRKKKRRGRVFLDYLRNSYGQTTVAPYALRAKEGAPVATPLDWDELEGKDLDAGSYTYRNIFRRLCSREDPWKDFNRRRQNLVAARDKLNRLTGQPD